MNIKDQWNARYQHAEAEPQAARVLLENLHLLPLKGRALDLACGRGGNAITLARQGLQVDAWDISDVAINDLSASVTRLPLSISAQVRDVETNPPDKHQYDVIVVSYFLQRSLFPALMDSLNKGGLIFYQTFIQNRVSERGPRTPAYRLADQELLQLLPGFKILVYREEGVTGDLTKGFRDEVMYVGMKPDESG